MKLIKMKNIKHHLQGEEVKQLWALENWQKMKFFEIVFMIQLHSNLLHLDLVQR